jgi:uncharacterized protein (TIGR02147 family)
MPDIFTYSNSRLFLKDYYGERKKAHPSFSYRYFANKAGFKSKTFIYKVISGEKTLSKGAVLAVAQAMGLKKREIEYFEAMVNFTQAKTEREREFYFNHLQAFGKNHAATQLRQDQFNYFSTWYLPAIREIVAFSDFRDDYKLLAKFLNPAITTAQAKEALKLLLDLGLIKRTSSGRYYQTAKSLTCGDEIHMLAVHTFQKENLRLAAEAIDRHERRHRDISTLTVGTTEAGAQRISDELASFIKRLAELVEKDDPADRVYQINLQVFPLSTLPKKG